MTFEEYKDELFAAANELGATAAEVCFTEGEAFEVNVLEQEIDRYKFCKQKGLSLRIKYDGRDGYAYTEVFEEAKAVAKHAFDNAKVIENSDEHPMNGACEYVPVQAAHVKTASYSENEKIELAKRLELAVKAKDPRVLRMNYCELDSSKGTVQLANTLGLNAKSSSEFVIMVAGVIMQSGEEVKNSFAFLVQNVVDDINAIEALADEVVRECTEKFGGKSIPSGEYKVLIRNKTMCDILYVFSGVFSADAAQKGMSLLAGKEGEVIAGNNITIIDDPRYEVMPSAFDGEGVPTFKKNIVENGVLKTLLHNLKTAKKAGCKTTGNAVRSDGAIGISPSNFYLCNGELTYEELIAKMGDGLIVTEFEGLNSGINEISGEFSLGAKGLLVENGQVTCAVDQITVAGSLFELLKNIEAVGSDLRFSPSQPATFGAPSVLVRGLMIAGE